MSMDYIIIYGKLHILILSCSGEPEKTAGKKEEEGLCHTLHF
jgi:hypothetical protein